MKDYNMSQHIKDAGSPCRIDFTNSELPNTFIELTWEFGPPGADKQTANRMVRQSVAARNTIGASLMDMPPEIIQQRLADLKNMQEQIRDLETDVEMCRKAKKDAESKYNALKKEM